jgi:hypothetical protein
VPTAPTRRRARIWPGPIPGTHEPGFVEQPIVERDVPDEMRLVTQGSRDLELHWFGMGGCTIVLGHEPANGGALRWHLTISRRDRHPSWDEIKTAKYRLTGPDMPMAMFLPPAEHYVNFVVQDHVFQLWELLDDEARDAWVIGS